jgi:hypothetical protein
MIMGTGDDAVAAVRLWAVVAVMALAGCSHEIDVAPYIWPTPPDNVVWTSKSFVIRYSEWRNTQEELRQVVAHWCGPGFDSARVYPHPYTGSVMHPQSLTVVCGAPPPPKPEFRGQTVDDSYLMPLKPAPAKP